MGFEPTARYNEYQLLLIGLVFSIFLRKGHFELLVFVTVLHSVYGLPLHAPGIAVLVFETEIQGRHMGRPLDRVEMRK